VRDEVTGGLPPELRPEFWRQFMRMPMATSACKLLSLLEPQDNPREAGLYRRRSRQPAGVGLFDDIPCPAERAKAEEIYTRLCQRHSERLASCRWLRPVLAGRARSMATNPEAHGSAWGRRMRRKKAGKHTQRRYEEQAGTRSRRSASLGDYTLSARQIPSYDGTSIAPLTSDAAAMKTGGLRPRGP
jgi:hypothetical protein